MKWIVGFLVVVFIAFVAIESVLLRASRYRLTHGDGRERSFRARS